MHRRAFFSAALAPALATVAGPAVATPPAYAPALRAYHPESFADMLDSGAPVALLVARQGCTNTADLDRARRALAACQEAGMVEAQEIAWDVGAGFLAADGESDPGRDGVRVVVYQDGAVRARAWAQGDMEALRAALAPWGTVPG